MPKTSVKQSLFATKENKNLREPEIMIQLGVPTEGQQNMPHQNITPGVSGHATSKPLLQYSDSFGLQAAENWQMHREAFSELPLLICLKSGMQQELNGHKSVSGSSTNRGRWTPITGEETGSQQLPIQTIMPPSIVLRVHSSFLKVICFHLRGLRPSSPLLIKLVFNSEF